MYIVPCIGKSMRIIIERDSIDKPLTFNVCLLQLIFHTSVFTYYNLLGHHSLIPCFLSHKEVLVHAGGRLLLLFIILINECIISI